MLEAASSTTTRRPARTPLGRRLFSTCDIASLVAFRIAFGLLMLFEVARVFPSVGPLYIEPTFHFTYYGFDWLHPWAGNGMYVHFGVLGLAALCVTLGLFYRAAALVFFLGLSYVFLLEQATYLNHVYLLSLISFLLIFLPAHRALSLDAWLRPELRSQVVPVWALWLLRAQIAIPYFYGGLAKLNPDWVRGQPLRLWLDRDAERLGPFLAQDWFAYLLSYGGIAFDLLIVPALLWSRTRPWAFALALAFHLTNSVLFSIGIFPWAMIAATTIFFPPDWPRRLLARLGYRTRPPAPSPPPSALRPRQRALLGFWAVYLAWQLLFPLRHWLYPGDVAWTEEGHKFSWRMKLRDKAGEAHFYAHDAATGETWEIDPRPHIDRWQFAEMTGRPEMILQFAHYLADALRAEGREDVEIHAVTHVSLNGRRPQPLVDPDVDLAAVEPSLRPAPWIRREFDR
jgi:hypothetical protein